MNAITAFKRKVREAYKPKDWKKHAAKLRAVGSYIENAQRQDTSSNESQFSTAVIAIKARPSIVHVRPEHSRLNENAQGGCYDDAVELFGADQKLGEEHMSQEQVDLSVQSSARNTSSGETDDQAARDSSYVAFHADNAESYTHGPVRMVLASDGLKQCVALLITSDFSAKVKKAVEAQREFESLKEYSGHEMGVAMRFEAVIRREIRNHRDRLAKVEKETAPDVAKEASLREELSVLEQLLEETKVERQTIPVRLESRGTCLRIIQAHANAYLEEAFVYAGLLEPRIEGPKIELQNKDLQEEYAAFCHKLQRTDYEESFAPLDISRDPVEAPPMTEEQRVQQDLVDAFWATHERFMNAQRLFDNREYWMETDREANYKAFERGEETAYATTEDFDLHWLKRGQEMTRELLEAEEALAAAKANLREAGIEVATGSQISESVFESDGDDRIRPEDCIASVAEPGVSSWLSSLSDPLSPSFKGEVPEADEWEAGEVGISDSVSVVAEGEDRKRIDKWKKTLSLE